MKAAFELLLGVAALAQAVLQYLYTVGKVDLSRWPWPFVHEEGRAWQLTWAAGSGLLGATFLAMGIRALAT